PAAVRAPARGGPGPRGGHREGGARPGPPACAARAGRASDEAAPAGLEPGRRGRPRRPRAVLPPAVHPLRGGRPGGSGGDRGGEELTRRPEVPLRLVRVVVMAPERDVPR